MKFAIEHNTISGWVNTTTDENGDKVLYNTRAEAEQALTDYLAELKEAATAGDMQPYSPEEFRVAEVVPHEYKVVFHVTSDSLEYAKQWLARAVLILDENHKRLVSVVNEDDDEGSYCSGHIENSASDSEALIDAARDVINNWEHGDLAAAVRDLQGALNDLGYKRDASTAEETPEHILERVQETQTAYWETLAELETELGIDLDSTRDYQGMTIDDLKTEDSMRSYEAGIYPTVVQIDSGWSQAGVSIDIRTFRGKSVPLTVDEWRKLNTAVEQIIAHCEKERTKMFSPDSR